MPLIEIPLWVHHGHPIPTKKKSILPTSESLKDETCNNDTQAAKEALSLLPNNKQQTSPPMYGVDVHPDGSRFATASGDGTVKIWSMMGLFGGRFDKSGEKRKSRDIKAWSKFTEGGNYVSSNSEGEGYDTSSSVEVVNDEKKTTAAAAVAAQQTQSLPVQGVNDLSGLVRRKKGSANSSAVKNVAMETKPLSTAAATTNNTSSSGNMTTNSNNNALTNIQPPVQQLNNTNNNTPPQTKQPKLLSTISSSHTGSILTLRFSPSGLYLATAGDDSYINIYSRSATPAYKGNLVDSGNNDVEHWNRIAVGRGHALDVVGLAWAPDDSHLVSCSLDSVHPVIVWRLFDVLDDNDSNVNGMNSTIHNLHPFKILGRNIHTSTVKGVAFDPAGKYIATSGDDPAVCIWRAFDDWGLESRIDATSGVFRSKKRKRKSPNGDNVEEDDFGELASLSLFRRISFSPDGSHVCATNASLRGKNIAAMISREGWAVSAPSEEGERRHHPPGAANLVGHKQPVVCSRHCPVFFEVKNGGESEESEEDAEPEYATLVALGDKKGFVTVWSTKLSRPLFKMQCSESRCTVTDISWGFVGAKNCKEGKDSLVMIVSLLDGYVVAVNFTIPDEVGGGGVLSEAKQRQIFRLKYGIDDFVGMYGLTPDKRRGAKRLVDDAGPMLIENALQLTMEMENEAVENGDIPITPKGSKKRVRTGLAAKDVPGEDSQASDDAKKRRKNKDAAAQDPLHNALDAAARADDATAKAAGRGKNSTGGTGGSSAMPATTNGTTFASGRQAASAAEPVVKIPYVMNKTYSVDLPIKSSQLGSSTLEENHSKIVADLVNSPSTPGSLPSAVLTISREGVRGWKDILPQVSCTALAANHDLLAAGTADGCLYTYGTSPTLGWESAKAFRLFPPFVLGCAVININFSTCNNKDSKMVIVTSDGQFYVYTFLGVGPKLDFKGSVVPPMQHLTLSYTTNTNQSSVLQPKLARIQITESDQLMLILSFGNASSKTLHGFVYNRNMEVWMRVSDSNSFILSNLYPSTPGIPNEGEGGLLSKMDRLVRSGASMESAKQMYIKLVESEKQTSQKIITRSHCEDRLACAIVLRSASEFQIWLSSYSRCLSSSGDADTLRFLVDVLLGNSEDAEITDNNSPLVSSCWWFNSITGLGLDNKSIILHNIIPEMSKNRQLQRLTNEISMELGS